MATYTLTHNNSVKREDERGFFIIPNDPMNLDWQEYKNWLSVGNTPLPYSPPPQPVPQEVPLWAVRVVLDSYGLLEQAKTLINSSNDNKLKMAWEYGNYVLRSSPSITILASALGLSSEQVDAMFVAASELTV